MVKEAVKIGKILKQSLKLAELYNNIEDSGTCNLDLCIVEFDNNNKRFIEIVNEICVGRLSKYKKNTYIVQIKFNAQGLRRTKKAEAVCGYLNAHGINSYVEYNLD